MKTILGVKGWDLSEYAISANAILGIRDSGKTYTGTEAAEELYDAGVPFIAFDPIGVWHSLRIPGKGKGYPVVVAGGKHADLPLTKKNAGAIVRAAMTAEVSLVLDLFSIDLTKADWRAIVRESVEILLHENSEHGLRHIFIEEAAEFVPQRIQDGLVFSAVEKLVRMGGNSKLGCTLINQRSADMNKSVLELCANVFVHRQTGKNTMLDLKKWFEQLALDKDEQARIASSLPDLKSGECWAFINDLKKPIRLKVPEKNSQHPDRRAVIAKGQEKRKPVPADAFVAQMTAKLAEKDKPKAAPVPALSSGQKINTPSQREVERLITAALAEGAASVRDQIPAMLDAQHKASFQSGFEFLAARRAVLEPEHVPARKPIKEIQALIGQKVPQSTFTPAKASGLPSPAAPLKAIPPAKKQAGGSLEGPLQRIVDAIHWWNVFGIEEPTHNQVGFIANYKPRGGSWDTYLSRLRSGDLIEKRGPLSLTGLGTSHANDPQEHPTGAVLRERVLSMIDGPMQKILRPILEEYPHSLSREAAGAASGYAPVGGSWDTYLSRLRSLDLIERRGELKAQAWLFPEGG